jgi:competence protein ComEC
MAVFSIVLIQPMLAGLWPWRNRVKDFFWGIFTVTVAAQMGVAGISLFYFHQFPGLFIIGNMFLLPVLPFIIGAALLLIVLLLLDIPANWLTSGLNIILEFIIEIVSKISSWDRFIIKDVYFSLGQTILLYVFLFSLILFFRPYLRRSKRERFYLKKPNWMFHLSLTSVVLFIAALIFEKYQSQSDQFLVLHQSTGSAVSLSNGENAILLTDFHAMDSTRAVNSLQRLQSIDNLRSKKLSLQPLENIVNFKDAPLIVIKENGLYDNSIKNAIVLLSHSPKINLERLILENQPKYIIADGSNYRNVVSSWKTTCDKMGVVLKDTNTDGAVVIE